MRKPRPEKAPRPGRKGEHVPPLGAVPVPELSRPIDVTRLGRLEHRLTITASEAERAALARRFDLVALDSLVADLVLKKRGDGVVELAGRFRARLAQPCVVTLEPVWADIDEPVRLFFSGDLDRADEIDLGDPNVDDPDPIVGGRIDCGEAVAQLLALALDPYPRAPGATLPPAVDA